MDRSFQVLIVGAGPVGLTLALELGLRGIKVLVIDQNARAGRQPRAKTVNIRTMAHMRRWGIAGSIRDASPLPADYPTDVVFATRLFGYPLAHFPNAFFGLQQRSGEFPEAAAWIPQYKVEAILRARLAQLDTVEIRFVVRLDGLVQDADGVTVQVLVGDTETPENIGAQFVVGADGGRSTTRQLLGIKMEGDHAYMANFLAVYRAPGLIDAHPQLPAISYWLVNPDSPAVTGPMDRDDTWFFSTQLLDGAPPLTPQDTVARIQAAIGCDVPIEILETDVWQAHKLIARTYRSHRIFLAGDACHLHPPMGGYGMNQGIGDAVDLGWKLGAVLHGWGGEALLDSYEVERKSVHRMFVEEATHNYAMVTHHLTDPAIERKGAEGDRLREELGERILAGKQREFRAMGAILGYCYASDHIVADNMPAPVFDPMTYVPSAGPGALTPHLWLERDVSVYDLFGQGFTLLLLGAELDEAAERIAEAAESLGIPLEVSCLNSDEAKRLYGVGMVLVRPDQHIAWSGDILSIDPVALLSRITGRTACKAPCTSPYVDGVLL